MGRWVGERNTYIFELIYVFLTDLMDQPVSLTVNCGGGMRGGGWEMIRYICLAFLYLFYIFLFDLFLTDHIGFLACNTHRFVGTRFIKMLYIFIDCGHLKIT